MELNTYIRSLLLVKPITAKNNIVVTLLGVEVEVRHVTVEESARAFRILASNADKFSGPEDALRKGKESWAREHGY